MERSSHMRRAVCMIWCAALCFHAAFAQDAPQVIKIGTLYASAGPFAVASRNQLNGLTFWARSVNEGGGVFVKAFGKKVPVEIISHDDHSADYVAKDLYRTLIEHDHVDVLVSDFGSVLTEPAIKVARNHHMLLIDPTGSSANFFTAPTNYLVDVSIPSSQVWPLPLSQFVLQRKVSRVAILYALNPFDSSQARTFSRILMEHGIYPYLLALRNGKPDYPAILRELQAANADAVIEFGYASNDIAFFQALSRSGDRFPMTFAIFPGQLFQMISQKVGAKALAGSYTYATPPLVQYEHVSYGMNTQAFVEAYRSSMHVQPNFLNVAGYNTGLIVQDMLGRATRFDPLSFHRAIMDMSGKTTTLLGPFRVNANGAQLGQPLPVAQIVPDHSGRNRIVVVYPGDKSGM